MTIRTKRGALKRYNALLRQCFAEMRGGLEFGMDWPTLRITFPERYAEIKALRTIFAALPD